MAKTNEMNIEEKRVTLSQIKEDLRLGLTKWKKDDIGFGSIEKKYNLLLSEAIELFGHPKIKNLEAKIPSFIIIDDLEDETPQESQNQSEARIEVAERIVVRKEQPKEKIEAFI